MTLLYLVVAWTTGILLAARTDTSISLWLSLSVGALSLAFIARRNRSWRLAWLCIMLLSLGAARYVWADRPLPDQHVAYATGTGYVTLTGIVQQLPDIRDQHVNLHVAVETLRRDAISEPSQGLVLVQASRYGDYQYGDRVRVSGSLLTPPEFDDFSYRDYLARRGIHAMIPNAQVDVQGHDQGSPWYAAMYELKASAQRTIDRILPSPQAPLLSGILLGVETGISDDVREDFNRTGTSHVIAISGSNIIVVISILLGMLTPLLGIRRASLVTVAGVAGYTLFVGADAAVVRAAIMGAVSIIATQAGRQAYSRRARVTYGLTALAFSVWLMTIRSPFVLWDVGFQLSVAATAGLVLFGGPFNAILEAGLRRLFANDTARQVTRWLSEPLTVSLAAQVTTTPLILLYFGRLSLLGLVANILIIPAQPYIMTLGGLATLAGLLWSSLGEIAAWLVWLPLTYTIEIVRAVSAYEIASIPVAVTSSQAWVIYSCLLGLALLIRLHPEDRASLFQSMRQRLTATTIVVSGLVITGLVWIVALNQPDGKLHVWFLDVGHGHAVLIQTPTGTQILVDGGPNPTQLRRAVGDALPFWDRDIDLMIVTQPRSSAIGGLPVLLDRYHVQQALTNGQTTISDDYATLQQTWEKNDIPVQAVQAGYHIETDDGILIEVLHPQSRPASENPTEEALVLRVSYRDTSFLLAPVLSDDTGETLLATGWYAGSTVLELPTYGDEDVNTEAFLSAIAPQVGVVSVGAGNRSNLPHQATIDRLQALMPQPLYRTDQHGTVEFVTDGTTLWIYADSP